MQVQDYASLLRNQLVNRPIEHYRLLTIRVCQHVSRALHDAFRNVSERAQIDGEPARVAWKQTNFPCLMRFLLLNGKEKRVRPLVSS